MIPAAGQCAEQRGDAAGRCERCGAAPGERRRGQAAGKVRDAESRADTNWFTKSQLTVLSFRLALFDDLGNVARLVPVEIRGESMYGALHENDEACVAGAMKGGVLRAKEIRNLTDGSAMVAGGPPRVALVLAGVLLALIAAFVVYGFARVLGG